MASRLYMVNYTRLFEIIKKDLARWEALPLSMFGRIETMKNEHIAETSLPISIPSSLGSVLSI